MYHEAVGGRRCASGAWRGSAPAKERTRISDSSGSPSYFLREKDAYEYAPASPRCSLPAETQLAIFHQLGADQISTIVTKLSLAQLRLAGQARLGIVDLPDW